MLPESTRRTLRRFRRRFLYVAALAAVVVAVALAPGCGKSDLEVALEAYKPAVEALLDQEQQVWRRFAAVAEDRADDARKYDAFVATEARPFYAGFLDEVRAIETGHPDIEKVHGHLIQMAERRLEFFTLEIRNAPLYAEQLSNGRVQELAQALEDAQNAETVYRNWVREPGKSRHFDGRFTRLEQLAVAWTGLKRRLHAESLSVGEVRAQIERDVLAPIEKLRSSKFVAGENGDLLRRVVASAERLYRLDLECMPLLDRARRATEPAQKSIQGSEQARKRFLAQLQTLLKSVR